jgi:enolase
MVVVKGVSAKGILDSRGEKTIFVSIETDVGNFSASAPNGKSKGKLEKKPYKKNLEGDIKTIKKFGDYFSKEIIKKFSDLRRVEDIVEGHVGANTFFALESAVLKAMAKEQDKNIWQLINPHTKKFPRLVGNCTGGGKHSETDRGPDFQEFLLIPNSKSVEESLKRNEKAKKEVEINLKEIDKNFKSKKNDENAWITSLNEKEVLEVLKRVKEPLGLDVAASSFFKRKMYSYKNPLLKRTREEQLDYLTNLIKNFNLFYIEDPFEENDFESFAKLLKKFPDRLIVGDDLTVTNHRLLLKAIKEMSINAIIVKPNQCGSLLEVKQVCEIAKEKGIKIVFSHRSGETKETILADLAFGFQADFFKCGITGKEREAKLRRLVEIEKSLK